MRLLTLITLTYIILIGTACTAPSTTNTNSTMEDTTPEENTIIKVQSSLPTPTATTMLMFNLLEKGEYTLPDGEVAEGQLVKIFSTDGDDIPKHTVGVGSEFEIVGHKYKVVNIVLSEDYTKSRDEVWIEDLGAVEN